MSSKLLADRKRVTAEKKFLLADLKRKRVQLGNAAIAKKKYEVSKKVKPSHSLFKPGPPPAPNQARPGKAPPKPRVSYKKKKEMDILKDVAKIANAPLPLVLEGSNPIYSSIKPTKQSSTDIRVVSKKGKGVKVVELQKALKVVPTKKTLKTKRKQKK